jgi:hypothetical protein
MATDAGDSIAAIADSIECQNNLALKCLTKIKLFA